MLFKLKWFKKREGAVERGGRGKDGRCRPPCGMGTAREGSLHPCPCTQDDAVELSLPGLSVTLTRRLNVDVPHEVTIIIPRAELRFRERETELIYSSITVVHAPRHTPAGEQPPNGQNGEESAGTACRKTPGPKMRFGRE